MIRTYSELSQLASFEERFAYLALQGTVGRDTFGHERSLNQEFYTSTQWRRARRQVIIRDLGCDLGIHGYEIHSKLYVHHMNPMSRDDVLGGLSHILNPEYLITTSHDTHNAIHYGDPKRVPYQYTERRPGDTVPWLK